jgi:predicted permease
VFARARSLWRTLRDRAGFEEELGEELRLHLELRAEDLIEAGLPPAEARRRARLELGSLEGHKAAVREARGLRLLDDLVADVTFALRGWSRHRGLALAIIATLTVGIGISTTVFALMNAFIFRAQGVPDPASFARVYVAQVTGSDRPSRFEDASLVDLQALLLASRSFAGLTAARTVGAPLGEEPGEVDGRLVACSVFAVHGLARPLLGRLLDDADCTSAARVLVLSEPFWRARFGADPTVVGKVLSYNKQPHVVVGVAPASFDVRGVRGAVWLPYTLAPDWPALRDWEARFQVTGRLRQGASLAQAEAELQLSLAAQDRLHPGRQSRVLVTNGSLWQEPGHVPVKLMIVGLLMGALAMIVLLAAANVVTLLLSRAHARQREIAVRLSLGAGRGRLIKMLMTETLLLALAAAGLSLVAAYQLPPLFLLWMAPGPIELALQPDWRVWGFLVLVTLVGTVASGLTPALEALNVNLVESLKGRLGGSSAGKRLRLRGLLIPAQIALSLALLAGAALFARSYLGMPRGSAAFETRQTLYTQLQVRPGSPPVSWAAVQQALVAELSATPGVHAVAFADRRPPTGRALEVISGDGQRQWTNTNAISGAFFEAIGVPILRGRALRAGDVASGGITPVVVSQQLAARLWRGADPLGQSLATRDGQRLEVVGVAADVVVHGESDGHSLYQPLPPGQAALIVRFSGDAAPAFVRVRAAIRRASPGLETRLRTFQQRYEKQAGELKPMAALTLILGLVSLVLALIGVHGVASFSARRQLKELGIRLALGAQRRDIIRALMLPTSRRVGLGLLLGLLITLVAAPLLARTVQEMNVWDPIPYLAAAVLLTVTAFAAMIRPARWALAVDPAVVLREE